MRVPNPIRPPLKELTIEKGSADSWWIRFCRSRWDDEDIAVQMVRRNQKALAAKRVGKELKAFRGQLINMRLKMSESLEKM